MDKQSRLYFVLDVTGGASQAKTLKCFTGPDAVLNARDLADKEAKDNPGRVYDVVKALTRHTTSIPVVLCYEFEQ